MATKLFDDIIIGPIHSRRLGTSLGVNLMPTNGKLCNFDCIYCECGWNSAGKGNGLRYNNRQEVALLLEKALQQLIDQKKTIDVITFAGNGEPTMHPDFAAIISDTIILRNRYMPNVKIAVLSNATMLGRESVLNALMRVDRAILKIDSADAQTIALINQPCFSYNLEQVVDQMALFRGEVIVQTMLLHGTYNGHVVDNTTEKEIDRWLQLIKRIAPKMVMLYSLDRDTPAQGLVKVSKEELDRLAERVRDLGIECMTT